MKFIKTLMSDIHFRELLGSSSITLFMRICGILFNYFFIFIVSKLYGAKILGIFALSVMILQVFSLLGKLGTDKALMKLVAQFKAKSSILSILIMSGKTFKIVVPWTILITIFLYLFSERIAEIVFHKNYLSGYFKVVSFAILANVLLFINVEKLRGLKEIKKYSLLAFVAVPMFSILILCLAIFFFKSSYAPLYAFLISVYLALLFSFLFWKNAIKKQKTNPNKDKTGKKDKKFSYKSLFSLSIPMMFTSSLILLMGWTDTFMLGIFKSVSEVGIYRVPLRLAAISSTMLLAVNSILGPKVAEFWEREDKINLKKTIKQSTMLIFWLSFPVFIILWGFPSLILGVFGNEFKSGVTALIVLVFGQFINSIVGSVGLILLLTGKQFVMQSIVIIGTLINIFLNLVLIPRYGMNGAAISSMISMSFINIIPFFIVKRHLGFTTISKKIIFRNDKID